MASCALLVTLSGLTSSSVLGTPGNNHSEHRARGPAVLEVGFQSLFQKLPALRLGPTIFSGAPEPQSRSGIQEDTEARNDWFTFQRAYPSNSIPPDARLRAWQSRPRYQLDTLVTPQAAKSWHAIGPCPTISAWLPFWGVTSGRVNSIAVSPSNPDLVLIGSSTGGIWRSTDAGDSFVPVSDNQVDLAVGSLSFSKSNPSIAYAGMGDTKLGYLGSGVLKSTDEGKTWQRVSNTSLPSPGTISKLEIDPANPERLYVAQYSRVAANKITSSGVCVSVDGGVNWNRVLAGAPRDLVIHPGDSHVIYAGLSRIDEDKDPPFGLYRSTDSGMTWSDVFTAPEYDLTKRRDVKIAVSPANPQIVYVYFGGFIGSSLDTRLRASTDGGGTWTDRSLAAVDTGQFGYNSYVAADPGDTLTVYIGSRDVFRSADGGDTWTNITRNFYDIGSGFQYAPGGSASHPDQHAIAFSAINQNEFYLGNDGGISKTTDRGDTFRSLNATLTLSQFIGIALHPTNSSISYGGTQDNGSQRRSANSTWTETVTGDGGHAVVNPLDPSIVFMTYIRGDIYRFANDGQTLELQVGYNGTFGEPFDDPRMAFYPPFVGNGVDSTLYFGTWRLFVSTSLGNSWFAPAGFLDLTKGVTRAGRDVLSAIAVSRSNTNVIYTGSVQGRVMVSRNGGGSWSDVDGLPDRSVTSITVDPSSPSVAYVTVSGFNTGHVFKTTNTGASWADISGTLPDVPANALLVDPADPNKIYLGTDIGVFRSTTQGSDWQSFDRGMPPVVVHDFAANAGGVIQVATYGRGVFELGASEPPSIVSVNFDGRKRLTIDGKGFGESATVIINGQDRSFRIADNSDTSILLTGKVKKLGLRSGDNTVQVITSDKLRSNVFTITITL